MMDGVEDEHEHDAAANALDGNFENGREEREEVWFDWSFVEFWKNNYCEYFSRVYLLPLLRSFLRSSSSFFSNDSTADLPSSPSYLFLLLADTIQRSINADPELSTRPADADSESAHLITSLRTRVKSQSEELEDLQAKLASMKKENEAKFEALTKENEERFEAWKKEQEVLNKEHEEEVSLVLVSFVRELNPRR